eukprot:TRINITY_DN25_c0_g1_i2.p1 TRINITY_DN25_c0_g1~~TRINITY_DN25_c0_g1_i2.p1  ORF type:complete len:155 (+),score=28.25 TRINITY_DN25_c0_g1_i2:79-543(+)
MRSYDNPYRYNNYYSSYHYNTNNKLPTSTKYCFLFSFTTVLLVCFTYFSDAQYVNPPQNASDPTWLKDHPEWFTISILSIVTVILVLVAAGGYLCYYYLHPKSKGYYKLPPKFQDQELAEIDSPPPLEPITDDDESSSNSSIEDSQDDETLDVE